MEGNPEVQKNWQVPLLAQHRPHGPSTSMQVERDCHLLGSGPSCSRLTKGSMGNVLSLASLGTPSSGWTGGRKPHLVGKGRMNLEGLSWG